MTPDPSEGDEIRDVAGVSTTRGMVSARNEDQSVEDRRQLWESLCLLELPGQIARVDGRKVIRSDFPIFHAAIADRFHEVELRGNDGSNLDRGRVVKFKLDPHWTPATDGAEPDAQRPPALIGTTEPVSDQDRSALRGNAAAAAVRLTLALPDRIRKVEAKEAELARRIERVEQREEAARALREDVEREQARIESERDALDAEILEGVRRENDRLLAERKQLEHEQQTFREQGGERFLELVRGTTREASRPLTEAVEPPSTLIADVSERLRSAGLDFDLDTVRHALVANLLAFSLGHLTLYAGPPGSGKSTLAQQVALALGCVPDLLPVRPGWLDAADLLGYYDSRDHRYVPTPFLEAVRASGGSEAPWCVVLDEMNIARVENYASDLLSEMENARSVDGARLRLYAPAILEEAEHELAVAVARDDPGGKKLAEQVLRRMKSFPPELPLTANFALAGTLNEDHTTYELSPKVKDRSLTIRVPAAAPQAGIAEQASLHPIWNLRMEWQAGLRRRATRKVKEGEELWDVALAVLQPPSKTDLYHVSHRTARTVALVPALADVVDIAQRTLLDDVLVLKVLPWVSFLRRDNYKLDDLKALADRAEDSGLPQLAARASSLVAGDSEVVQYLR